MYLCRYYSDSARRIGRQVTSVILGKIILRPAGKRSLDRTLSVQYIEESRLTQNIHLYFSVSQDNNPGDNPAEYTQNMISKNVYWILLIQMYDPEHVLNITPFPLTGG